MIAWKNNGDSGKKETHKMEGGHKKKKKFDAHYLEQP